MNARLPAPSRASKATAGVRVSLEPWPGKALDAIYRDQFNEVNQFPQVCTGELHHERYLRIQAEGRLVCVVARLHNVIVGYLVVIVYPHLLNKGLTAASDNMFFVRPVLRGRGIASKMMELAMGACRERGAKILYAHDKVNKKHAEQLLFNQGFKPWQTTWAKVL